MKSLDDKMLLAYDILNWTFKTIDARKITGMRACDISYNLKKMREMGMVYIPNPKHGRIWHKCYKNIISWMRAYLKNLEK